MTELCDYWKEVDFHYLKTFSGLRGKKNQQFIIQTQKKISELKNELDSARFMRQGQIQKQIERLEYEINGLNSFLVGTDGSLHQTTELIIEKKQKDPFIEKLDLLFSKKCENPFATLCVPIFRDAIVFYSKTNEIIGILHLCFECGKIKDENRNSLEVDFNIFEELELLFKGIGHPI